MKTAALLLTLQLVTPVLGQDFTPGYTLLETGQFAQGATYFKTYLQTTDSTNRTALLCYGRGIGLSGRPQEAGQVFGRLMVRYPDDLEIKLNWAESLLWNGRYADAQRAYEQLLATNPTNTNALLGLANAFSSLKHYEQAVHTALRVEQLQPKHPSLRLTLKYARLGWASQCLQRQHYASAQTQLTAILSVAPADPDALYLQGQLYLTQANYTQAEQAFQTLAALPGGQTKARLQLAYGAFLQKNYKTALQYATQAEREASPAERLTARLGRVNALGWNGQFRNAYALLDSLEQTDSKNVDLLLARARLSVWSKRYALGSRIYQQVLRRQPNSFDATLGYADACHALGLDGEARKYAQKTLANYPNQRDAVQLLEQLQRVHAPQISTHNYISRDNGQNDSQNLGMELSADLHPQYRLSAGVGQRLVGHASESENARLQTISVGLTGLVKPFYRFSITTSHRWVHTPTNTFSASFVDLSNRFQLGRFQALDLRYVTDMQTYTARLVAKDIRIKQYMAAYSVNTPFRLGLYTQYIQSTYSDANRRRSLFASLYYDLSHVPVVKVGVNGQYIQFAKRVSRIYFSPFTFRSVEIFGQFDNLNVPTQRWLVGGTLAAGLQQVEDEQAQPTFRFQANVGYRVSKAVEVLLYASRSNSATSTVAGYAYQEFGFKAKAGLLRRK
jgi:tetratricopeptide (TPR) repeat protein